jgi:hypothetical protein
MRLMHGAARDSSAPCRPLWPRCGARSQGPRGRTKSGGINLHPPPRSGGGGPCEAWWRGRAAAPLIADPSPFKGGHGGSRGHDFCSLDSLSLIRAICLNYEGEERGAGAPEDSLYDWHALLRSRAGRSSKRRFFCDLWLDNCPHFSYMSKIPTHQGRLSRGHFRKTAAGCGARARM